MVQPILNYGCEVWAPYLLSKLNNSNLLSICDKLPGESLHIKVCKIILGVHNKSTNNAVRGELGSHPLLINMLCLALKYWWLLNKKCFQGDNSLVVHALLDNRKQCDNNFYNWSSGIKDILQLTDNANIWCKPNILQVNTILPALHAKYNALWFHQTSYFQPKLRCYCTFKEEFGLENYVYMFNKTLSTNFSRLRVSAHSLLIEKGRHLNIPRDKRLCKLCESNEIEDELHFMLKCSYYDKIRVTLFNNISEACTVDFNKLSDNEKFVFLMSVSDYDCILSILRYVNGAFEKRNLLDL